jgi:hypothetical protein
MTTTDESQQKQYVTRTVLLDFVFAHPALDKV